jgi:TMEM175 potassium channel family protein
VSTGRLESFSDGVIAVAITLLVLNIAVPPPATTHHLGHALANQWPIYAAYVTSFITIGIIWINHHVMIGRLARPDHSILMLNLVLLLTVAVIPFGTALLASYLKQGQGDKLAAAVYGGILLAMALAFATLNRQILLKRPHLLERELSLEYRRRVLARSVSGVVPYVIATALAAVSPYATLIIAAVLALFYALPIASSVGMAES